MTILKSISTREAALREALRALEWGKSRTTAIDILLSVRKDIPRVVIEAIGKVQEDMSKFDHVKFRDLIQNELEKEMDNRYNKTEKQKVLGQLYTNVDEAMSNIQLLVERSNTHKDKVPNVIHEKIAEKYYVFEELLTIKQEIEMEIEKMEGNKQ